MSLFEPKPLGKEAIGKDEPSSYIATVMIPYGIDRTEFINHCYQTGTVMVFGIDSQRENNVLVDRSVISYIKFPTKSSERGSLVICVNDPIYKSSKLVGVFRDSSTEQEISEENQWRIFKRNGVTFVDIDAKANSGELNITVHSGGYKNVESNFKFLNKHNKAKLNLLVQGDVRIDVDNKLDLYVQKSFKIEIEDVDNNKDKITVIEYVAGKGFNYKDEFENELKTTDKGFELKNKSGQQFKLGEDGFTFKNDKADLKEAFTNFLDAMIAAVIITPAGPGNFDAGTIQKLNKYKTDIQNLFS